MSKCKCGKPARTLKSKYCEEWHITNKRHIEKISQRKRRAKGFHIDRDWETRINK